MPKGENLIGKGGPGRPKGVKNKANSEAGEFAMLWANGFFNALRYLENAERRILAGRAAHLESYWLPRVFGKPTETVKLQGDPRLPIQLVIVRDPD
jgi:hypothetical protein